MSRYTHTPIILMALVVACDPSEETFTDEQATEESQVDAQEPAKVERMTWHVSEPEPVVHDESPARFRLMAPAPIPEAVEVEITRFADQVGEEILNWPAFPDPLTPDAVLANGETALSSFTAQNEYHDRFGYSIAVGDFNNDTYDDLAIGAPFEDLTTESTGVVFVFEGSFFGLNPAVAIAQIGGDEAFDRFGWALAVGDFDGDGIDDLAASALNEGPGGDDFGGAVFIYTGSNGSGLASWDVYHQESPALETNEDRDLFGYALSAGDYNDDGATDLAVGAPGEKRTVREGVVYLLEGDPLGIEMTSMGEVKQSTGSLGTANDFERFGSALASGDLFGGDADELVVGAYNDVIDDWRGGSVFIYQYSGGSWSGWGRRDEWTVEEDGDDFGRAVAVADFDDDGNADLAVGAPGENNDTGAVFLFRSNGTTLSTWETLARPSGQPGDRFGASLAAGQIDTDDKAELVVGAPRAIPTGASNRAGVARVFFGHATSMIAHTYEIRQTNFGGSTENSGENTGFATAIGNFRGISTGAVAVSTPDDNLSGKLRVGSVDLYTGTGSGGSFSFTASQRLAQQ